MSRLRWKFQRAEAGARVGIGPDTAYAGAYEVLATVTTIGDEDGALARLYTMGLNVTYRTDEAEVLRYR